MKKRILYTALAAFGLMTFASCNKDNTLIFRAHVGQDTKMHIYDNNTAEESLYFACWDDQGKRVYINGYEATSVSLNNNVATIACNDQVGNPYYLFTYGAGTANYNHGTHTYTYNLPASEMISAFERNQRINIPMGVYAEAPSDVNFKTPMAIIKFEYQKTSQLWGLLQNPIQKFEFETSTTKIAGNFSSVVSGSGINYTAANDATKKRTIEFSDDFGTSGKTFCYIVIPVINENAKMTMSIGTRGSWTGNLYTTGSRNITVDLSGKLQPGVVSVINLNNLWTAAGNNSKSLNESIHFEE